MKLLAVSVIVCSAICAVMVDGSNVNSNNDNASKYAPIKSTSSLKTKRGILHHGYAGGYAGGYALPSAFHKHYTPSVYANIPGLYKNVLTPTATYAISHGGATVHSYNVNYPKYNYVQAKPIVHIHPGRPAVLPPPLHPLAIVPSSVAAKPIIPISYPVYANRVPFVLQKPVLVPVRPSTVPTIPIKPHVHHHVLSALPSVPGHSVLHRPLVPVNSFPQPTLFNYQPDGWRPIVGYPSQIPLTPTSAINPNTPPIALLPPIGSSATDVQPAFASSPKPPPPNNSYLTPTEGATLEQVNQLNAQHQSQQSISNDLELAQAQEEYQQQQHLQHHLEQLQRQEELQHIHHQNFYRSKNQRVVSLANQGYEPPSNNGHYAGLSSYDVQLNSRTRLY